MIDAQKCYEIAYDYDMKYGNCAQCVVAAIQEAFEIEDDGVFKSATGFAGGMGLRRGSLRRSMWGHNVPELCLWKGEFQC